MARVQPNVGAEAAVRALKDGEMPWTLHPACDFASDPGQWGASLVNHAEVMIGCLDAVAPRSVVEVGAYAGDLTGYLLDWAQDRGVAVCAIDPSPQPELAALARAHPELKLVRATSIEGLTRIDAADAYVIDGDHNYYTVSEEIRLLMGNAGRAEGEPPLLLFHDVCWPHGRRDDYFAPELIPGEYRQPIAEGGGLFPGFAEPRRGGLPYKWPAAREGGPRNGVLTAVEDFVAGDDDLRLAILPAFFGLGIVWHRGAGYSARLEELLAPLDRNPIVARLEANRVLHLASMHAQMIEVALAHERLARQELVLRRLLTSSAFKLAEVLSRVRQRMGIAPDQMVVSRREVLRALDASPDDEPARPAEAEAGRAGEPGARVRS